MASLSCHCPACNQKFECNDLREFKTINCPNCGQEILSTRDTDNNSNSQALSPTASPSTCSNEGIETPPPNPSPKGNNNCIFKKVIALFKRSPIVSEDTKVSSTDPDQKTKICPMCGEEILFVAKKCRYCGEYLDEAEKRKHIASSFPRSRATYVFLAILGGWFSLHNFYARRIKAAICELVVMAVAVGLLEVATNISKVAVVCIWLYIIFEMFVVTKDGNKTPMI